MLAKMEFRGKHDRIGIKDIDIFRKKYKLPELPKEYVKFMLDYNGGKSIYDTFEFQIENKIESTIISFFYHISDDDDISTMNYAMSYISQYPKGLLPIATDYLGNQVCLCIKGKLKNRVFVWIHDLIEEDDEWANVFFVSDSFESFLASLTKSGVNDPEEPNKVREICKNGDYKRFAQLLKKGVPAEELGRIARACAYFGQIKMINLLVEYDCSMKLVAYVALKGKQTKTAIYLIENFEEIDAVLPDKSTWLHKAIEFENNEVAKYLIKKGCDINATDSRGLTALDKAFGEGLVKMLEKAGGQRSSD